MSNRSCAPNQPPHKPKRIDPGRSRRGVAMLLVMAVLAVTLAVAYAFVHRATIYLRIAENASYASRAIDLAHAGAGEGLLQLKSCEDLALECSECFASITRTFEGGRLTYDVGIQDITDLAAPAGELTFRITSTGRVYDPALARVVARRVVEVEVRRSPRWELLNKAVLAFGQSSDSNRDVDLDRACDITGDIHSNNELVVEHQVNVTGNLTAVGSITNGGYITGSETTGAPVIDPPDIDLQDYLTYQIGCSTYNAADISGTRVLSATILGPTLDNPLGIYYHGGDLDIGAGTEFVGTLIVDGKLKILAGTLLAEPAVVVQGTRTIRLPTIICTDDVDLEQNGMELQLSGLIYGATRFRRHSRDLCSFLLNGAVVASSVVTDREALFPFDVIYDALNANVGMAPGFFTWEMVDWKEN